MTLIFSYSTLIGDYPNNDFILNFYKLSMAIAKEKGHGIKFYGCSYSLNYLKGYYDEFVDVSDKNFILTDDLKIYIHTVEPCNSVTIDGDIILYDKLTIDYNKDISIEKFEPARNPKSRGIKKTLKNFDRYDLSDVKYYSPTNDKILNVGILRFRNEEIKKYFIDGYYNFREYYLKNIEPKEDLMRRERVCVVLCQFYFNCIAVNNNISIEACNETNLYKHYMGPHKLKDYSWDELKPLFEKYSINHTKSLQ